MYTIKCDLAARTMVVYNEDDEEVMFVQKSMKTLILNAAIGAGSETLCDIAPGVDITVMAAILFGVKQVRKKNKTRTRHHICCKLFFQ